MLVLSDFWARDGSRWLAKRWKLCVGGQDPTAETHAPYMDMYYVWSYELVADEGHLALWMTQLRADRVVSESVTRYLLCGDSEWDQDWFVDKQVYSAKDADFEIQFRQQEKAVRWIFAG